MCFSMPFVLITSSSHETKEPAKKSSGREGTSALARHQWPELRDLSIEAYNKVLEELYAILTQSEQEHQEAVKRYEDELVAKTDIKIRDCRSTVLAGMLAFEERQKDIFEDYKRKNVLKKKENRETFRRHLEAELEKIREQQDKQLKESELALQETHQAMKQSFNQTLEERLKRVSSEVLDITKNSAKLNVQLKIERQKYEVEEREQLRLQREIFKIYLDQFVMTRMKQVMQPTVLEHTSFEEEANALLEETISRELDLAREKTSQYELVIQEEIERTRAGVDKMRSDSSNFSMDNMLQKVLQLSAKSGLSKNGELSSITGKSM